MAHGQLRDHRRRRRLAHGEANDQDELLRNLFEILMPAMQHPEPVEAPVLGPPREELLAAVGLAA